MTPPQTGIRARRRRIQISNHSYGGTIGWNGAGNAFTNNQNLFGQYNAQSVAYDNVVTGTNLIVVKSAGNDRNDAWDGVTSVGPPTPPNDCFQGGLAVAADCIGPRACAKNLIALNLPARDTRRQ